MTRLVEEAGEEEEEGEAGEEEGGDIFKKLLPSILRSPPLYTSLLYVILSFMSYIMLRLKKEKRQVN